MWASCALALARTSRRRVACMCVCDPPPVLTLCNAPYLKTPKIRFPEGVTDWASHSHDWIYE